MEEKKKNKSGYTLLEVILSVALIALLLIPITNIIMASMKTSNKAGIKQEGSGVGQRILEELKTYENINILTNTPLTLLSGYTLNQVSASTDTAKYTGQIQDGNKRYDVELTVKRSNDFTNYITATNTAATTKSDDEYTCKITFKKDGAVNKVEITDGNSSQTGTLDTATKLLLDLEKNGGKVNVTLEDYSDNHFKKSLIYNMEINKIEKINKNAIRVVIEDSFDNNIPIILNNGISGLKIDIIKGREAKGNITISSSTKKKIEIATGTSGLTAETVTAKTETFTSRQNIKTNNNTEKMGDMYNITVQISNNGEEIFKSEVSNNMEN